MPFAVTEGVGKVFGSLLGLRGLVRRPESALRGEVRHRDLGRLNVDHDLSTTHMAVVVVIGPLYDLELERAGVPAQVALAAQENAASLGVLWVVFGVIGEQEPDARDCGERL